MMEGILDGIMDPLLYRVPENWTRHQFLHSPWQYLLTTRSPALLALCNTTENSTLGINVTLYNSSEVISLNSTHHSMLCTQLTQQPEELPAEMKFNEAAMMSVIAYCVLFLVAACGNLTVFITLFRNRHRRSRVNRFIMHLSIADLIVTFIMLPLEISWHLTVAWIAGDFACRIMMFFRAFGFYLSSFVLVTISLDRYFAILHPLSLNDADKRGRIMLIFAWLFSFVASVPQSIIFHVEYHPKYEWFAQCVTFNFFPSEKHELAYNLFNLITVYGLPLLVIVIAYTLIICEMTRKSRESKAASMKPTANQENKMRLRRSGVGQIEKARVKTLKMTIVIVLVFILCWTPYFVISTWWWFDKDSADTVDPKIQRGLFLFAVSNSCMDPLVYGMFTIDIQKELTKCCCKKKTVNQYRMVSTQNYINPTRLEAVSATLPGIPATAPANGIKSVCNHNRHRCSELVEAEASSNSSSMASVRVVPNEVYTQAISNLHHQNNFIVTTGFKL